MNSASGLCPATQTSDHAGPCQKSTHLLPGHSPVHLVPRHAGWECRDRIISTPVLALVCSLSGDTLNQTGEGVALWGEQLGAQDYSWLPPVLLSEVW